MPNAFIDNRDQWIRMAEIDYLGQFVKAWLAFNAWYRSASSEPQDRKIIDGIKWQGNAVLNKLRPMLEAESEDAEQFRAEIGLLHHRLKGYEIPSGKGAEKERITLCNIFLCEKHPIQKTEPYYGYAFHVERVKGDQVTVEVRRIKDSVVLFQHTQKKFDLAELQNLPDYQKNLKPKFQSFLRQVYAEVNPRWVCNLETYQDSSPTAHEIKCGAYVFQCGKEALFAGVVEAIYQMRCTLFHGELAPTKDAVVCYEPAYRLVRRFLECVS